MKVELSPWGNNPVYEVFSDNSVSRPLSRVILPAFLEDGVGVIYEGKYQTVEEKLYLTNVFIFPTDKETSASVYIYGFQEKESLIGAEESITTSLFSETSIYLAEKEYSRLFSDKPKIIRSQLQLYVDGEIRFSAGGGIDLPANVDHIQTQQAESSLVPTHIVESLERFFVKAILGNIKARYGQLAGICYQFGKSLAVETKKIQANIPTEVNECREILNIAKLAFTTEEVRFSDETAKVLWQHQDIVGMIQYGDAKKSEHLLGFQPNSSDLEEIAKKLLSLNLARSQLLENCVLDALVFSETIAFARIFYSKKKMLGMRLAEPLQGTEDDSLFVGLSKILGQGLAFYAKEIIFIAITYGVAFMLAAGDVTAAWVITSVFTVYRWYSKEEANKEDPEYKEAVLLNRMITFYSSVDLNQDRVTPELMKRKLLELEADGAVYSRFVYELIERKLQYYKRIF